MPQFKYLIKVEAGANNNKYYKMMEQTDGTFKAEYGRVGCAKPAIEVYPMSKWDSKLKEKLGPRKKYEDKTELFAEVKQTLSSGGVVATDTEVANFIIMLQGFAQAQTAQTYLVQATSVTQRQIDAAQKLIDDLSERVKLHGTQAFNVSEFNFVLKDLYQVIPRKMKNVADHMISAHTSKKQLQELLDNEQSNLDSMAGQVSQNTATQDAPQQSTLLESLGLKLAPVTDKKILDLVKKKAQNHGSKVRRVFAVVNEHTQKLFDDQLGKAANKTTEIFWHGSRRANWWSILQKGLLIRPSTAVYTGSMFGDGIYFASECDKSMGYTDGHRWTGGSRNGHVYMALYEVHIGKQYITDSSDSSLNYRKIQSKGGYDSTWGKAGRYLMRHEYIIYQPSQCTIKYIVEFEA